MISYNRTLTITSPLRDCVDNPTLNEILPINSTTFFAFNINTLGLVASSTTTNSSNTAIALCNSSSACVFSNTTNVDLIQISTGYKQNFSGGVAVNNAQVGQQAAGDTTNNRVIATTGNSAKVFLFDGNTWTGSNFTVTPISNQAGSTTVCTLKAANRWLIGSTTGMIVEMDYLGNVYKTLQLPQQPNTNFLLNTAPYISGLSFDGTDFLAVTTKDGFMYVYAYASSTLLYVIPYSANATGTNEGTALCSASSGTTFLGYGYTGSVNNVVAEVDFTTSPPRVRDVMFLDSTGLVFTCGLQNANGWICQASSNKIQIFTVTSRNAANYTSTIQNPPGTTVGGRIIRIIDNAPNSYVDTDTIIGSQSTSLPTVKGQSVIEIALIGSGVNLESDITRFNS